MGAYWIEGVECGDAINYSSARSRTYRSSRNEASVIVSNFDIFGEVSGRRNKSNVNRASEDNIIPKLYDIDQIYVVFYEPKCAITHLIAVNGLACGVSVFESDP
jgi:hypothetical protein